MSVFRRIVGAVFLMMLGAGMSACLMGLHLVRSSDGLVAVPKTRPAVRDAWADVRNWNRSEWRNHPDLVEALRESGNGELVPQPASDAVSRAHELPIEKPRVERNARRDRPHYRR